MNIIDAWNLADIGDRLYILNRPNELFRKTTPEMMDFLILAYRQLGEYAIYGNWSVARNPQQYMCTIVDSQMAERLLKLVQESTPVPADVTYPVISEEEPDPAPPAGDNESKFVTELNQLINRYSIENGSDTPDFILAEYLMGCLRNFNEATKLRTQWYTPTKIGGFSCVRS
jgi:hypothetical protein